MFVGLTKLCKIKQLFYSIGPFFIARKLLPNFVCASEVVLYVFHFLSFQFFLPVCPSPQKTKQKKQEHILDFQCVTQVALSPDLSVCLTAEWLVSVLKYHTDSIDGCNLDVKQQKLSPTKRTDKIVTGTLVWACCIVIADRELSLIHI